MCALRHKSHRVSNRRPYTYLRNRISILLCVCACTMYIYNMWWCVCVCVSICVCCYKCAHIHMERYFYLPCSNFRKPQSHIDTHAHSCLHCIAPHKQVRINFHNVFVCSYTNECICIPKVIIGSTIYYSKIPLKIPQ